ncbi:hypothetical protein T11_11116 [Trichinella zimbabwensis]|uniref:Uncharacterized protein n=1 Tax=Trichinella zimbabwensis TaxID=268475 RepID=A0A0V1HMC0_9BILA|nr:hypothetical protein T11_11116 [Trichinella zimbabwensis]
MLHAVRGRQFGPILTVNLDCTSPDNFSSVRWRRNPAASRFSNVDHYCTSRLLTVLQDMVESMEAINVGAKGRVQLDFLLCMRHRQNRGMPV